MNAPKMDWRHEMHNLLSEFERQTTISLGKLEVAFEINGLLFSDEFKKYFLRASNHRYVNLSIISIDFIPILKNY